MRKFNEVIEDVKAPNTQSLWLNEGSLSYYGKNGWESIGGSGSSDKSKSSIKEITHSELKEARDNGKLVPGQQYRITDYICTTAQAGTKSAGHVFDIIVTANNENTLNEKARAIHHEGDTYFANSDLSAWKLWYCLDSDSTRFNWAVDDGKFINFGVEEQSYRAKFKTTKVINNVKYYLFDFQGEAIGVTVIEVGAPCYLISNTGSGFQIEEIGSILNIEDIKGSKGIIYRMIDEFGNDVPYDFKNIQFYRQWDNDEQMWIIISSDNTGVPCYTFSSYGDISTTEFFDISLNTDSINACSNIINKNFIHSEYDSDKQSLNNICFFGRKFLNNVFGNDCYNNSFKSACSNNSFKELCYNNSFKQFCSNNLFGSNCYNNSFEDFCSDNIFGNGCNNNSFKTSCRQNKFGNNCFNFYFEMDSINNSFGNYCNDNNTKRDFKNNKFGNYCLKNSFGKNCTDNIFGSYFSNNIIGDNCSYNVFGNECKFIIFKNEKNESVTCNNYKYNNFGDNCQYILFAQESSSGILQNYNFIQCLQGTSTNYIKIVGIRGITYEMKVAKNSSGEIKIYCEADLVQ